jgi:cellulose synthase/poly-beta-1,6-N-acetylglucosamine synthase-like glycosyltransferase
MNQTSSNVTSLNGTSSFNQEVLRLESEYIVLLVLMLLMALFWFGMFTIWKLCYYPNRHHIIVLPDKEEYDQNLDRASV